MESASNKFSLLYHNIFDYPLTSAELFTWTIGLKPQNINAKCQIKNKNNFYFINGRQNIITKRLENKKYSEKKITIAKKAVKIISKIPTVRFVGITGALAMMNAGKNSDIDLIIITKTNMLWTTRLFVYLLIYIFGIQTRKPRNKRQKDRLCLNMWLDENGLVWDKKDRNIYTAHEIAQVVPLVNKDETYEKFLYLNKWVLNYWPYAVSIKPYGIEIIQHKTDSIWQFFESLAYKIQYLYMKSKISREIVTPTRAIFHPNNWSKIVVEKLKRS